MTFGRNPVHLQSHLFPTKDGFSSLLFSPKKYGLLDPATSDGRVIFFLPWEGKTIVGTTDRKCDVTYDPKPSEEEIEFVLKETQKYLNPDLKGIELKYF